MHLLANHVSGGDLPVAAPQRAAFGWPTLGLDRGRDLVLRWTGIAVAAPDGGWLRVTSGADDREEKIVAVHLAGSGALVGRLDLRFTHAVEPFQLKLAAATFAAAQREGLRLVLEQGTSPWWILAPGVPASAAVLAPHLLPATAATADEVQAAAFARLASLGSAQTFGWMEGCVLDALYDLRSVAADPRWETALRDHLALFIAADGALTYEDPKGRPADGTCYGIEGTLPFAVLAKRDAQHPLLAQVLAFWRGRMGPDQAICDHGGLTAEGCYTVAYPLAVLAAARHDSTLAALAAIQLRLRRDALHTTEGIWLRHAADGTRTFRSWARGVAWYLLGLVRALEQISDLTETTDLQDELRRASAWALGWQRSDGLWGCFLDDPATACDTSGSAGIAAALVRGARRGWLGAEALAAGRRTWQGLQAHLTPDGLLSGAAQSNRGGEALQRGAYRVLSPMGLGLLGQLAAALGISPGAALPRLFVVGDSISIQYGPMLERRLSGHFAYDRKRDAAGAPRASGNLDVPTGANGGDSSMVLDYLRHRQATAPIEAAVLLLNCGLHDIKTDPVTRARQVDPVTYERNLRAIISTVAAMGRAAPGPTPIWVRTTPVIDEVHNQRSTAFQRFAADVATYNAIADGVMAEAGIQVLDLHGFSADLVPAGFCDHVHYRPAIRDAQAEFLATRLLAWWAGRSAAAARG